MSEPDGGKKFYGKYKGTVVNNVDPLQQGRLLVQVVDVVMSALTITSVALAAPARASPVIRVTSVRFMSWLNRGWSPERPAFEAAVEEGFQACAAPREPLSACRAATRGAEGRGDVLAARQDLDRRRTSPGSPYKLALRVIENSLPAV